MRVAGWLTASQGVRAGDRVAICLPKSVEAVQAIYGILAAGGAEVEPGQTGEIVVCGPSVLLGYWKDPELTAAKRIAGLTDSYRTGDLAFFGEDRLLHLLGRKDQVVKLRAHPFDLGEIEAVLRTHPAVREAIVFSIAGGSGESEIAAAVLAEFPLPSTGKVDRQALKKLIAGNGR